ncbi:hypothetical protein CPAR01_09601 [Colletotrichum paranaense]|uniref:NACHT domain-containing protein n=1 Tax=Colletotrichum paranaense TaxID=1914294 RepID=A0ABQ9SH81_9PEZI|nr:uncharacterized protein CPAR01_09601 [Colletotrichum paranaense]KAK1536059.1 hypothetical protein CPAR01_09601 [Colletotrichum paranaense]
MGLSLKKKLKDFIRGPKKDDAPKEPLHAHPSPRQQAGALAEKAPSSCTTDSSGTAQSISATELSNTLQEDTRDEPAAKLTPSQNSEGSIRQLWDVAYQNLRNQEESLVQEFEDQICGNLAAGLGVGVRSHAGTKDWLATILKNKMDQVNRESWRLKFGSSEVEVQDIVKPVLAVVDWANDFVAKALVSNPYASIAWSGVSLLLPLLLNPLDQAAALAKGLEHISSLIVRSSMWEDLYVRRYESKTSEASPEPHAAYRLVLERLYREILKFQIVCYRYHNHKTGARLALDSVKHHDWEELLEQIKYHETEFDKVSNHVQDQAYTEEWEYAEARHQQAMNHWERIGTDVSDLRRRIEEIQNDKKRKELLNWLCTVDPSVQYNAARSKHRSGTCEWLIQDNEDFKTWETAPTSFLWLNGKAGSGKSILSSSVIKHLKEKSEENPQVALAYYFFSFGNLEQQKVTVMLSSLIGQLCASRPDTPQPIKEFESFVVKRERPDTDTLENALRAAVRGFSAVYIVVDALDECPILDGERTRLMDCLSKIISKMPDNLHIFCTSRAEPDIRTKFEEMPSLPTKNTISLMKNQAGLDSDLSLYIDATLATGTYKLWPPEIKTEAKESLLAKADGMFQYLVSQFEVLQKLNSREKIRSELRNLPSGLDATYNRLLLDLDPDFQPQILDSLKWLAFSSRPLSLAELAEIFIFRPGVVIDLKEERLFAPEGVLRYFSSLVTTETREEYSSRGWKTFTDVRLAHFTVKEYLISNRIEQSPAKQFWFTERNAHLHIAHCCLSYHVSQSAEAKESDYKLHLESYAIEDWVRHLDLVPRHEWSSEVIRLAERALSIRSNSLKLLIWNRPQSYSRKLAGPFDWKERINLQQRPYCYTAGLGSLNLTKLLLRGASRAIMYLVQEDLNLTLRVSAKAGHHDIVQFILARCAGDKERDAITVGPLQAAAYRGHLAIISLLLDSGADINAYDDEFGSALKAAAMGNQPTALQLLLSRGADVRKAGCLLSCWISTYEKNYNVPENTEVLQLLLDSGADINNKCARHGSPLNQAIKRWLSRKTRSFFDFVVEHGADITLDDGRDGTPLQAACLSAMKRSADGASRSIAVIEALLDMGADVNGQGGEFGNALQTECRRRYYVTGVISLLLDRGAEINNRGGRYETALHAACSKADPELVNFLLDKGADPTIEGGEFGSVLQAACSNYNPDRRLGIVKKLVEKGADINAVGGKFGSALQAAASHGGSYFCKGGREDVETFLLSKGAEVNMQGGIYGTALQGACKGGKMGAIRLLLSHGADVNVEGGKYGTALQAACAYQQWEKDCYDMPRLLIEHGANVHVQGGLFGSAWHAAAATVPGWSDNTETMRLLLDHGIDIDSIGRPHGTALQAALEILEDHDRLVPRLRLLLERGADVNLGGGQYGFPLQSACVAPSSRVYEVNICGLIYLLENCPEININMTGGLFSTALQAATSQGKTKGVELLLQKGADTNIRGGKYRSALNAAIFKGYWDLVEILLDAGAKPDCHHLSEPDKEWLESIGSEHGKGAVDRYRKFWEIKTLELSQGKAVKGEND